jgi:hypothetical protein
MGWTGGLVRAGLAEWGVLGNGDVELRFMTGEVFRFSEELVMRVARSLPLGQKNPIFEFESKDRSVRGRRAS